MSAETFTEAAALAWMLAALDDVRVNGRESDHAALLDDCGEVNCTALAEACAAHFGADDVSEDPDAPAPLDDDGHWIWDAAVDAARVFEAGRDEEGGGDGE